MLEIVFLNACILARIRRLAVQNAASCMGLLGLQPPSLYGVAVVPLAGLEAPSQFERTPLVKHLKKLETKSLRE